MKKIFSLLLLLTIIAGVFCSCGDREYDEAEVKEAARVLLLESEKLNDIFWGEGIPYNDDINLSDGIYYEAVYTALYSMGFMTIDELKVLTKKTFTDEYSEHIFSTVLSSISDENEILMTRYYQKYSTADGKTPEAIMVNSQWDPLLKDNVTYDYDTIQVTGSKKQTVYFTVEATVSRVGYDKVQKKTISVGLIEEDDGWRIDSPTYLSYDVTK